VHLGPLEEFSGVDQSEKLLATGEVIFASVHLVVSRLARGV
jgi:hypothetical protein